MNYTSEIRPFMTNIQIMKNNLNESLLSKVVMGIATYNQNSDSVLDKIFISNLNGFNQISLFSYESHKDSIDWFNPIIESINQQPILEDNNE